MLLHTIEFVVGLLIVLAVFLDVFSSVLVPRAAHRGIRIGPALVGVMAPLWRHGTGRMRSGRNRQNLRGSLGPAIMVLALATWVTALSIGFALMLLAQPENVLIDGFGFGEALFQSALAISTLGMIHADIAGWARAVVAVAGVAGFAVLSLVVASLLSIQNALHRRESLVLTLPARAGRPPSALRLVESFSGTDDAELAAFFARWEEWAADTMQSHLSYPVLFRFRSLDEDAEWLVCLAAVLDAAALLRAAAPADYPQAARAAGFLTATAGRAIHEYARVLRVDERPMLHDQGEGAALVAVLDRWGFAPTGAGGFADRLRAARAGYGATLPRLADRLDLMWSDSLLGQPPLPGL